MARRPQTNKRFHAFLRATFGLWLRTRYRLRIEGRDVLATYEAPYLVLPNHICFWDPMFVSLFIHEPIYFVASDRQFRIPAIRFLLTLVGAIPKSKAVSDFETVKSIFAVSKRGGLVGLFPEGRRCWDGHTLPLLYPTAKLVKSLHVPVVVPIIKGAFMALPRWSRRRRNGPVTVEFRHGFTAEELASMSVDEIYEKMTDLLEYDEREYQRSANIAYRSEARADGLDLAIFVCQSCGEIGSLTVDRHTITCGSCDHAETYTEYGTFEPGLRFEGIREWNLWQIGELQRYVEHAERGKALCSDGPGWMFTGYRSEGMTKEAHGRLDAFHDRVRFVSDAGDATEFSVGEISGVNVQTEERMEFYCRDRLYNFKFDGSVSGYKWMMLIRVLKGKDPTLVDL